MTASLLDRLRRLGNAGAVDNVRRSLDEHRLTLARVDALARELAGSAASTGTSEARPGRRASA